MINWAETQKEYQNMLSSSLELSTQVVESQNEVTRLEQLLKSRGEGYESALAEMVKSYDRELAEKSDRLVGMTNQWLAAEEQAEEAANLLVSLNIIARQQSTEILLLKAEVYDLTHQREN
jgi:small-conductance mechanosensitive channel